MGTIFFTGFPGFLGVQLLPRVLRRSPESTATCLVQPKFAGIAHRRRDELVEQDPSLDGRIILVEGDITKAGLGLDDPAGAAAPVSEVWHLAAVYDLSVPREIGELVNVTGTRHVLDFAEQAGSLERFQYVSTCYVSGRYAGPFAESDLDKGQTFNNFYEETKFLAEVDVQRRMTGGLPTTIYRPAIVVGDSTTGETQKYDGPYYPLRWLLRQPKVLAVLPVVGDPTAFRFNIVPRNFVVDAIAHLSADGRSKDRVYQLADPNPLTVHDLYTEMGKATGRRLLRVPLTASMARFALDHVPGVQRIMQIPSSTVAYLTHPTHYLTGNQADLDGSGISCPAVPDYLPTLVDFMRRHPDISSAAMV